MNSVILACSACKNNSSESYILFIGWGFFPLSAYLYSVYEPQLLTRKICGCSAAATNHRPPTPSVTIDLPATALRFKPHRAANVNDREFTLN